MLQQPKIERVNEYKLLGVTMSEHFELYFHISRILKEKIIHYCKFWKTLKDIHCIKIAKTFSKSLFRIM